MDARRHIPPLVLLVALGASGPGAFGGEPEAEPGERLANAYYSYLQAHRSLSRGEYGRSAEQLESALRSDPDARFLNLEIAEAYLLEGEAERAEETLIRFLEKNPDHPGAHKLLAEVYLRQVGQGKRTGYIDRAIEQYRRAIRLQPDDPDGVLQLGTLYRNVGRTEEAIRLLEDFRTRHPGGGPVNLLLANTLLQIRETDRAEALLRENLALDPGDLESVDLLGSLYENLERYDDAIQLYRRLSGQLQPNHYLFARLGYLHLLAKNFPEAVRYLEQARQLAPLNESILINLAQALEEAGDLPGSAEVYGDLLRVSPTSRSFLYHLGRIQGQLGRIDEALAAYRELARDLESGGARSEERSESITITYLQIGNLYLRGHRPAEAVSAFQKAMKSSSGNRLDAYRYLARAYLEAEKFVPFWKHLERAERRFPDEVSFPLLRGEGLLRQGKTEEGIRQLRSLWRTDRVERETVLRLADLLLSQEVYREADNLLERALVLFPDDDMMFFQMGALRERQGRLREAEKQFRRALAVNPDNPLALNYLGYMLVEEGDRLEESLGYIQRAVELDRWNAAYLDSLGWAYFKLERLELAVDPLEEAARLSAGDPVIEDHLGDLYFRLDRLPEAIEAWNRALEAGNDDPAALREKIRKASRTRGGKK